MSKALPATCTGGVVTTSGLPIAEVTILSEGMGASDGILVIDEADIYYLAKTTTDLKTTITKLVTVIDKISTGLSKTASALTTLDTRGFWFGSGTPSPPIAVADISSITGAVNELAVIKTELNTLKGVLK